MIKPDGLVAWLVRSDFLITCALDMTHFPMDQQLCSMNVSLQTYQSMLVNLTNGKHMVGYPMPLPIVRLVLICKSMYCFGNEYTEKSVYHFTMRVDLRDIPDSCDILLVYHHSEVIFLIYS